MDSDTYYLKNSSKDEKVIEIPKSRSTLDQDTIIQACTNFDDDKNFTNFENDSSCASIPKNIYDENISGFEELRRNHTKKRWCIDAGFLLKLTKK